MSRTKKLVTWGILAAGALWIASCTPTQSAPPPTVAILPSLSPTTEASIVPPTEVVIVPSATERPTQRWYAVGQDLIPVYDCAELTCGVIGTYDLGEAVDVYNSDGAWHEVRLPDASSAYVQFADLAETEPTTEPTATGTVTARPTRTLIPSRTPSNTPTPENTSTATSTRTSTTTRTSTSTSTRFPTLALSATPFPTLPLVGPGQSLSTPVIVGTTDEQARSRPTNTISAPSTLSNFPATFTYTPSVTLQPPGTATLNRPPEVGNPTLIIIPSETSQPTGNTPPPGSGGVFPSPNAPPPGSTPPPGVGITIPTSSGPPPPPPPPPGA